MSEESIGKEVRRFVALLLILIANHCAGYWIGADAQNEHWQRQAIKAGVAHWTIDLKSGERKF